MSSAEALDIERVAKYLGNVVGSPRHENARVVFFNQRKVP